MTIVDVPSPIDLREVTDALEWESSAMSKRPWRTDFFDLFAATIKSAPARAHTPARRVLELGSGPGFLARHLLAALSDIEYVALDFSPAMHKLAQARLGGMASRVRFVERSFREADWAEGLGSFEFVVTNQAVHELRHKRHAAGLHEQVLKILAPGGSYLVCDHFSGEDGMSNDQLYMSVGEQQQALCDAGFSTARLLMQKGGLVLHRADR